MKKSTTTIATSYASRYIGQLCRHFRHKIDVEYRSDKGHAIFPYGTCEMTATSKQLLFAIAAPTTEELEKVKGVLIRHLLKFSYKEELIVNWQDL